MAPATLLCLGYSLILVVGVLDYLTGYEFSFAVFYLVPVSLVAWYRSGQAGVVSAVVSASVWFLVNHLTGGATSTAVLLWNAVTRFGFLYVVALLIARVRAALEREREASRTDYLTGALNTRAFYELAEAELRRAGRYRHPFTIAYMDLDDFKLVNDQMGHKRGDELLQTVAETMKMCLRRTDAVARLGGDEFAALLPETGATAARAAVDKMRVSLLAKMGKHGWPVGFSIGVLTCDKPPPTSDEMLRIADQLMYEAKTDGKNHVRYAAFDGEAADGAALDGVAFDGAASG